MKKLIAILTVSLLSGCAGLSEAGKAEKVAFKEYQKADALVARKEAKLALATASTAVSTATVISATLELYKAKLVEAAALENLNNLLGGAHKPVKETTSVH